MVSNHPPAVDRAAFCPTEHAGLFEFPQALLDSLNVCPNDPGEDRWKDVLKSQTKMSIRTAFMHEAEHVDP
jgi:hypothetical protein